MPRIALDHLVGRLEARVCDLRHTQLLVIGALGADYRGIARHEKVHTRIGHQARLELGQIDVNSSIKAQTRCQAREHLGDEPIQIGECRSGNVFIIVKLLVSMNKLMILQKKCYY